MPLYAYQGYINANAKLSNGLYPIEHAIWIDDDDNLEYLAKYTDKNIMLGSVIFSLKYNNLSRSIKLLSFITSITENSLQMLFRSMNDYLKNEKFIMFRNQIIKKFGESHKIKYLYNKKMYAKLPF